MYSVVAVGRGAAHPQWNVQGVAGVQSVLREWYPSDEWYVCPVYSVLVRVCLRGSGQQGVCDRCLLCGGGGGVGVSDGEESRRSAGYGECVEGEGAWVTELYGDMADFAAEQTRREVGERHLGKGRVLIEHLNEDNTWTKITPEWR